jgi:hypothetical protein
MECCQGSIVAVRSFTALPRCFPKASAKVMQVFELAKKSHLFFQEKQTFFGKFFI